MFKNVRSKLTKFEIHMTTTQSTQIVGISERCLPDMFFNPRICRLYLLFEIHGVGKNRLAKIVRIKSQGNLMQ